MSWLRSSLALLLFALYGALACRPAEDARSAEPPPLRPAPDAEIVAVLTEAGPPPGDPDVLRAAPAVIEYGPHGSAAGEPALFVRFSSPMQPAVTGAAAPRFEVTPTVDGTVRWIDPYRLDFVFDDPLPPASVLDVRVKGELVTTDGHPFHLDLAWDLETEPPYVDLSPRGDQRWGEPVDEEGRTLHHWKEPFIVSLTPWVRPEELRPHVTVTARPRAGGPPTPVKFRVESPRDADLESRYPGERTRASVRRGRRLRFSRTAWEPGTLIIEPVGHWPADAIVTAEIDADFHTRFGPLTLGRAVGAELATIEGLTAKLQCETDHGDGCGPGTILVELDGPVSMGRLAAIDVQPRPRGLRIARPDWHWPDDHFAEIEGRFETGTTYRVTVPTSVQDAWGQRLPEPVVFEAKFVTPPPQVTLSSSHGVLPAHDGRTVGLETRWVKSVRLRAAVLTDEQLLSQWLRDVDDLRIPSDPVRLVDRMLDRDIEGELGWASTAIDLEDLSEGGRRPVIVEVEATEMMPEAAGRPVPGIARGIWQQTDLGAVAVLSPARSLARVHGLADGAPRAAVDVDLFRGTRQVPAKFLESLGQTDRRGVIELPRSPALPKRGLVRMRDGDDRFVLRIGELRDPQQTWRSWNASEAYTDARKLLHELVTERPLYRPGDEVHVVGWLAISDSHSPAGLRPPEARTAVELELLDREGETVAHRRVRTSAHGKYWATLTLPADGGLGRYTVRATVDETTSQRSIVVREFATPSFEVRVDTPGGDVIGGEAIEAKVSADYFFGGTVPTRSLHPRVPCYRTSYRPPGLASGWIQAQVDRDDVPYHVELTAAPQPDAATRGRAQLAAETATLPSGIPYRCTVAVAVEDESYEQVGGESTVLVHPQSYLLAQSPGSWKRVGDTLRIPVRAVDFAAERRAGIDVVVQIEREDVHDTPDGWVTKTVTVKTCRLRTRGEGDDPVCETKPKRGRHRIHVHATGDGAPAGEIELSTWVGPKIERRRHTITRPLELEISPASPRPGEKAQIRVRSTASRGEGLLVLAHGGLRRAEPFSLEDGRATLDVQVDESWVPGMKIEAALVVPGPKGSRPNVLREQISVQVGDESRRLQVFVEPPAEAAPDADVEVAVTLRDAAGDPVAGHVALWAVDEAVLSLMEPTWPDLVERFTVRRGPRASIEHDYDLVRRPYTPRLDPYLYGGSGTGSGFGSGSGRGGASVRGAASTVGPPPARQRFETTPIFIGDVEVGPSGRAQVKGRMPENLTTFRVTAIASAPLPDHEGVGRFGLAEGRIRVTVPLALRAVLPRVLRPGDRAQLAAMIDNRTGPPGILEVSMKLSDARGVLASVSESSQEIPIEAGGQVRVPFDVHARGPGTAQVELTAVLTPYDGTKAGLRDAMKVPLPVTVERTLVRRSAVYGEIDDDDPIAVRIDAPPDAVAAKVETSVEASLLGGLDDVARDLVQYPYGCMEQTASRMVPLLALGRLDEHHLPPQTDVDAFVRAGVARIRSMQTASGGFAYWPGDPAPHPYASAYGLWVLEQVAAAGHDVPESSLVRARDWVQARVAAWAERSATSLHDDVVIALAVHALAAGGRRPEAAIARLVQHFDTLPTFARGLVVLAMAHADPADPRLPELVTALAGEVDRQGAVAHVRRTTGRFVQYFDSGTRSDAIILLALLRAAPEHALVVPLARGLTVHRGGGLRNTQERAYGLLALADYASRFEPDDPSFVANLWHGALPPRTARFDALLDPGMRSEMPLLDLGEASTKVTLERQGRGRAYWRVGMTWSPKEAPTKPVAAGLAITTTLRGAGGPVDPDDVIAPGTPLAIDVSVTADAPLDYVALEIPLPAGLEAIDTSIGKGRAAMVLPGSHGWWVDHRELYPDRALVFADRLPPGERVHTIFVRAATPGDYSMPPAHAEAMYLPEIHGHDVARRVRIALP